MGRYDVLEEVEKFNPYHGTHGYFSSANAATSMTTFTTSAAGQKAIANIRERAKTEGAASTASGPFPPGYKGNTKAQKDHPEGFEEGADRIAKDLGVSMKEAYVMHRSIDSYCGSGYDGIRTFQREGPPPDWSKESNALESFIEKSPKWDGGTVYRGIMADDDVADTIIANAKAGKTMGQMGTSSWSTRPDVAEGFAGNTGGGITAIIFQSSGKQNGTSIQHISGFAEEEAEVLMSNNARWKPTNVTRRYDGTYIIDCEPVS